MQIKINKDLEEEYRDEFIRGFSVREALFILGGFGVIAGITALAYFQFGIMPDIGIYIGLPFGIPVLTFGFFKYQGLTLAAYLKEIFFVKCTKILTYDADELPKENRVFTMKSNVEKRRFPWK